MSVTARQRYEHALAAKVAGPKDKMFLRPPKAVKEAIEGLAAGGGQTTQATTDALLVMSLRLLGILPNSIAGRKASKAA